MCKSFLSLAALKMSTKERDISPFMGVLRQLQLTLWVPLLKPIQLSARGIYHNQDPRFCLTPQN